MCFETYSNSFATFFDMDSVKNEDVGCLSQFYIREGYRGAGIGTEQFNRSISHRILNGFITVLRNT